VLAPIRAPLLVTTDAMVEACIPVALAVAARARPPRVRGERERRRGDGGRVVAAVLALAAPPTCRREPAAIVAGVRDGARAPRRARRRNLASARELSLTIAVVGAALRDRPVARAGARHGDRPSSRALGGAAFGLRSLLAARSIASAALAR